MQLMWTSEKSCGSGISMHWMGWYNRRFECVLRLPFLPECRVMSRGLIEMHSAFREQKASIESRNIIIFLWPRVSSRNDCAFRWL